MRLKEWQKIVLIIFISGIFAFLFYRSLFRGFGETSPKVQSPAALVLTLMGSLPERAADDPLSELAGENAFITMQNALQMIRNAKRDTRIKMLVIRPAGVISGWAKTDELRNALLDFKTSGKPLYAYLEAVGEREYYLATAADTIVGLETGIWNVNGLAARPTFYKEMFSKIGVTADFVAHKEYKTAPEEYTRSDMSPQQREVLNTIVDQYYGAFVDTLAASRAMDADVLQRHIDTGLFSIKKARELGFVDTLLYYENFKSHLEKQYADDLSFVGNSSYANVSGAELGLKAKETIAVVFGVGTIVVGGEGLYRQGNLITSSGMSKAIRDAAADASVKAIILRLDSPGGSGTASDIIWHEIMAAREKKPVIASVSDLAASGGYYLAMAADTIIAHPNSLVGSIGIYAGKFALGGLYDKIGLTGETIKRGKNADLFSEVQPFTPEQRQILSNFLMVFYEDFVQKAADSRNMTAEEMELLAKGRVWTGIEAQANGLIDVLGDFSDAIRIAKEMADIPAEQSVRLAIYPRLESYFERLVSQFPFTLEKQLLSLPQVSPPLRQLLPALPHLRPGEPLFIDLTTLDTGL